MISFLSPTLDCLECSRDLRGRVVVPITKTAIVHGSKQLGKLIGPYCSSHCALNAYQRGVPKTKTHD